MTMIRMKATSRMPEAHAKRMQYRTRMLTADIMGGAEFEVGRSDAVILAKAGWAEETGRAAGESAPMAQPEAPRRGRPPKVREPEPEAEEAGDEFENMTVAELRQAVEARGHALEPRYYRRDELLAMARGESAA